MFFIRRPLKRKGGAKTRIALFQQIGEVDFAEEVACPLRYLLANYFEPLLDSFVPRLDQRGNCAAHGTIHCLDDFQHGHARSRTGQPVAAAGPAKRPQQPRRYQGFQHPHQLILGDSQQPGDLL